MNEKMKMNKSLWRIVTSLLVAILFCGRSAYADDEYENIRPILKTCFVCHGENGVSTQKDFPILAGQHLYYVYVQLKDYKSGLRANPIMGPIAAGLDKEKMLALGKFFSEQTWPQEDRTASAEITRAGQTVINAGQCVACHLGDFEGNSRVPRLAGQYAAYLNKTMLEFKTKTRKNSPAKGSLMASFSDKDIKDVSDYLATLKVVD